MDKGICLMAGFLFSIYGATVHPRIREGGYMSVCSCEPWGHMCLGPSILCMIQDTQQEVQSQGLSRPYAQHKVSMCVMKIRT